MSSFQCRCLLVTVAVLVLTTHRLPAPISEETPTPAPKPEAVAKSKSKSDNTERAEKKSLPKVKQSPFAAFVGVWSGPVTGSFNTDIGLNIPATTTPTTFRISNDGTIYQGQNVLRTSASPDGRALTWTGQYNAANGSAQATGSLRLIAPNTASYQQDAILNFSGGNGTMKWSGTLRKQ